MNRHEVNLTNIQCMLPHVDLDEGLIQVQKHGDNSPRRKANNLAICPS